MKFISWTLLISCQLFRCFFPSSFFLLLLPSSSSMSPPTLSIPVWGPVVILQIWVPMFLEIVLWCLLEVVDGQRACLTAHCILSNFFATFICNLFLPLFLILSLFSLFCGWKVQNPPCVNEIGVLLVISIDIMIFNHITECPFTEKHDLDTYHMLHGW